MRGLAGLGKIAGVCDFVVLLLHLIVTIVRLAKPDGLRSVVAESVLIRYQFADPEPWPQASAEFARGGPL